ncbi:MAG: molybdenum cofactor guanylyltransferase [Deltaproteobacteria bacterium]|nr:molybdenum cofactor guanylyltransferase [Deltaproteobacteria bacterium]
MPLTGIILAGGRSSRLGGGDKPWIEIGGQPVIRRLLTVMAPVCQEILISSSNPQPYGHLGIPIVPDLVPGLGALGGLYSSLCQASHEYAFVVAGDMPFVGEQAIRCLWSLRQSYDVVLPRSADGRQPLHALYSRACRQPIREQLKNGHLKISSFFPQVRVFELLTASRPDAFEPHQFFNLNTPADITRALQLAAGTGKTAVTDNS